MHTDVLPASLSLSLQHPGSSGQLHALREHEQELQDDILQCQKENMRLRFEYEQARVELPRLKVPFFRNFGFMTRWFNGTPSICGTCTDMTQFDLSTFLDSILGNRTS